MKRLRFGCVTVLLTVGVVCRAAHAQADTDSDRRQDQTGQSAASSSDSDAAPTPASDSGAAPPAERPLADGRAPTDGKTGSRMFGVLPNYATVEGASTITPISPRQKFELAKMNSFDPYLYPFVGVVALIQRSYGPGSVAYMKQYAASFTDNSVGNVMTTAVLPSLLHQDPRYFQRGRQSVARRLGYSASRLVITHGDAGRAQFNLSEVGGNATAAIVSNAYYPMTERGVSHTMSRLAMQLMWDGLSNELKEFWPDVRRRISRQPKTPAP
jgi:hypothetical protein